MERNFLETGGEGEDKNLVDLKDLRLTYQNSSEYLAPLLIASTYFSSLDLLIKD